MFYVYTDSHGSDDKIKHTVSIALYYNSYCSILHFLQDTYYVKIKSKEKNCTIIKMERNLSLNTVVDEVIATREKTVFWLFYSAYTENVH